jgi:HipA-like protein
MTGPLLVILDNAIAGTLTQQPGGKLRFDYDQAYLPGPNTWPRAAANGSSTPG